MNFFKKIQIFFKLHWAKILVVSIFLGVFLLTAFLITTSLSSYFQMEPISRRPMLAYIGFFLIIGILGAFVQLPLFFGMHYYFMQGGGLGNLGREKMDKAKVNVKWTDVIGMDAAKQEAWELVKLLKDRSLLKAIGGKIIKGTMMIGPPGCGKTYLAKAIATECGLPMISASGSDFVGMFVGQGAAQMKSLFKQARAKASIEGGCLIFIDEIDSFARPRQEERGFGGATSHNATINQFLTELDGLRQAENNIVILAATNVPESELDPAIVRSGRFDRKIYVTKPNLDDRKLLFRFYLSRVTADKSIDVDFLARKTLGFSSSDVDNMVREAGLIALRETRETITTKDLNAAYDRVVFGLKANITLSAKDKEWTAYHEAGHAVIAYLKHPSNDVIKATIVPRKGNLGFVSQRPVEETYSINRDHLLATIKVSIASFVAEKIKFGTTSSGVGGGPGSDFDTAMRIARDMVWRYGMGPSGLVGDFYVMTDSYGQPITSEKTKEILDSDVQTILKSCISEVEGILAANKELLESFAQELLKKQELEYDEIVAIFDKFGLKSAARPV